MFREPDAITVQEWHPLVAQPLPLHYARGRVARQRQGAGTVDDAVPGDASVGRQLAQCPADFARGAAEACEACDVAVGGHVTRGYAGNDVPDTLIGDLFACFHECPSLALRWVSMV